MKKLIVNAGLIGLGVFCALGLLVCGTMFWAGVSGSTNRPAEAAWPPAPHYHIDRERKELIPETLLGSHIRIFEKNGQIYEEDFCSNVRPPSFMHFTRLASNQDAKLWHQTFG